MIAVADRGTMFDPGRRVYMEKIAAGPDAVDAIDITLRERERRRVAEAKGCTERDLRRRARAGAPRRLIAELRAAGAKVHLIRDGDVAPAIAASQPGTGVDLL